MADLKLNAISAQMQEMVLELRNGLKPEQGEWEIIQDYHGYPEVELGWESEDAIYLVWGSGYTEDEMYQVLSRVGCIMIDIYHLVIQPKKGVDTQVWVIPASANSEYSEIRIGLELDIND